MNDIVTLSQLITRMAKVTGTDTNTARRFVRAFFASIEDALAAGESVEVKGIGTFRRNFDGALAGASPVFFVPDKALAEAINAPFAMFEAVELAPEVSFDEEPEEEAAKPVEEASVVEETQATQPGGPAEPVVESGPQVYAGAPEPIPDYKPEIVVVGEPSEEKPESEEKPIEETVTVEEYPDEEETVIKLGPADDEEEDEETVEDMRRSDDIRRKSGKTWLWILLGILAGAAVGLAAAYLAPDDFEQPESPVETNAPAAEISEVSVEEAAMPSEIESEPAAQGAASKSEAAAQPAAVPEAPAKAEPRYDTVTRTRYLATMAREYYGKGIYWVFIYEANADKLRNPNSIAPGTRVLIPEKSSFAEATEEATMRKAEAKKAEIDKRY